VQRLRLYRRHPRRALGPDQADVGVGVGGDDLTVPRTPFAHLDLIERHRLHRTRRQNGSNRHQIGTRLAPVGRRPGFIDALDFSDACASHAIDLAGDLSRTGDPQRKVLIFKSITPAVPHKAARSLMLNGF
jgi:hypothetical protein